VLHFSGVAISEAPVVFVAFLPVAKLAFEPHSGCFIKVYHCTATLAVVWAIID